MVYHPHLAQGLEDTQLELDGQGSGPDHAGHVVFLPGERVTIN